MNGTARQIRCGEGGAQNTHASDSSSLASLPGSGFLFFSFRECSALGNIDKPEIPDIGVARTVVDGKPLKDDAMTPR